MRDAEAPGKEKEGKGQEGSAGNKGEEPAAPPPPPKPLAVLRANAALIEKAVAQKETRTLFGRVLRHTAAVRRRLTATDLVAFVEGALPAGSPALQQLVPAIKQVRWAASVGIKLQRGCVAGCGPDVAAQWEPNARGSWNSRLRGGRHGSKMQHCCCHAAEPQPPFNAANQPVPGG